MRIVAELVPRRAEQAVELRSGATGLDLLRSLGLAPDAHLLVRNDTPIPLDEVLEDGQRVRVIGVVSGGRS
ncbi:MAG TPA: MoaD/ThiS family protein [Thermoplasmata archaeon]